MISILEQNSLNLGVLMEKEENINLDDLFSSFEEKQLLNKRSSFIAKDEKANLLRKKEDRINKINESLKINQSKKEIIEKSINLNYKSENIKNWLCNLLNVINDTIGFLMMILTSSILTFILTCCFVYTELKQQIPYYDIWLVCSLFIFFWSVRELKKYKWNVDIFADNLLHNTQKSIMMFFQKTLLKNYGQDTFDYVMSNYKSKIYYENKTDNELYNSFLLKEIDVLNEKNLSNDLLGTKKMAQCIVETSNHQYQEYIDEMKELQLMQRFLK